MSVTDGWIDRHVFDDRGQASIAAHRRNYFQCLTV